MGILTNLLDTAWREQDIRRKEEQDRFATIAQVPGIRPEIQEWALDQLVKTAPKSAPGIKDIGGLFKNLIKRQRGADDGGFQQAMASTGRPGMSAPIPAGPAGGGSLPGGGGDAGPLIPGGKNLLGATAAQQIGAPPAAPPTQFGGSTGLPGETAQVPGVKPTMMLSPQEQLNLKLDEFRQTERIRNDLQMQMKDFQNEQQLQFQAKQDEQQQAELDRRIRLYTPIWGKEEGINMAYSSLSLTPPIKTATSNVPGLVLGSDPELQAFLRKEGLWEAGSETKQYHVVKDSAGKIVQALEGPGKQGGEFKGTLGEDVQAQSVVDEYEAAKRTGRRSKHTESEYRAAKDFLAKQNRPPIGVINFGERKADAKEIAAAIRRHDQPPLLTGLGPGGAGMLRAELAKPGPNGEPPYNLTQGMEDWAATTRYISSANSATQLRLRQATDFSYESLNLLDNPKNPGQDLIGQLRRFVPRSKYPVLNQAALNAAKNGLFGDGAASAATQLLSQIRDLQSELATVYKGGNSPTDIGLKQAIDMLNGNWSEGVLRDGVGLSRVNLGYRLNSIKNSGPITPNGDANPYYSAPAIGATSEAPPPIRNRAAEGELPDPPKKGTQLDAETGQKFLDAFNGDKAKAFAEATRRGWKP